MVKDVNGNPVQDASVSITSKTGPGGKSVKTSARGEYWKLLLPGDYRVTAELAGCSSEPVLVSLTDFKQLVVQNITINTKCK